MVSVMSPFCDKLTVLHCMSVSIVHIYEMYMKFLHAFCLTGLCFEVSADIIK
jgi:hypothetical protein